MGVLILILMFPATVIYHLYQMIKTGKIKMYIQLTKATLRSDIADLALRLVAPGARKETVRSAGPSVFIVDLCTGTGSVLVEYARRNPNSRIVAVDSDPEILKLVRGRLENSEFSNIEYIVADAADVPIESGSCDLVNISFGLHENNRKKRIEILRESYRILNSSGRIVVTDYREVTSICSSFIMRVFLKLFEPPWINELFEEGLTHELEEAGFNIEKVADDLPLTRLITAVK